MSIFAKLENFVSIVFKTTLEIFLEALKFSPNAQGYVSGSISEFLLMKHLESLGFTTERIREKWQGRKHPNHHGDFYFKDTKGNWFVLESKGLKSNSEKWNKLYNYDRLKKFLFSHHDKINWINNNKEIESQIENWIQNNLPKFLNEYSDTLYDYEEILKYNSPTRETNKSKAIDKLRKYTREQIGNLIDMRLDYLKTKIKVLDSHFVAGKGGLTGRTQATPRKDEFNIISVDLFLRFIKHRFVFANPLNLESSGDDANHLQQNYIMGFVFNEDELCLSDEWCENFNEVLETIDVNNAIQEADKQSDNRSIVYEDEE